MEKTERGSAGAARRSRFFYGMLRMPVLLFAKCLLGFKGEKLPEIPGNYLLLCNHNTDYDMLMTAGMSRRHMYYVSSEHVFQKGWASKLLMWALSPIIRQKGSLAVSTVMTITRALRRGDNVCIFAEGNRSYDGVTCRILPATGKLAKAGGAYMVTYRLEGGYFATPRWGYSVRRGGVRGKLVNVYSPEQLRDMTVEQVNAAIAADLWEDAYARQQQEMRPFPGKRLAEGLEHVLYICPVCGKLGELTSSGDELRCSCGAKWIHDKFGFLRGERFSTVYEWNAWQRGELKERLKDADLVIRDGNVTLYKVSPDHRKEEVCRCDVELKEGMLVFGEYAFPLEELEGLAVYGRANAVIIHAGGHFEFKGAGRLCALKYIHAWEHITGKSVM